MNAATMGVPAHYMFYIGGLWAAPAPGHGPGRTAILRRTGPYQSPAWACAHSAGVKVFMDNACTSSDCMRAPSVA